MSWIVWTFLFCIFFGSTAVDFFDSQLKRYHDRRLISLKRDKKMKLLEEKLDTVELQVVDAILEQDSKNS